jgi:hypothetical protein
MAGLGDCGRDPLVVALKRFTRFSLPTSTNWETPEVRRIDQDELADMGPARALPGHDGQQLPDRLSPLDRYATVAGGAGTG